MQSWRIQLCVSKLNHRIIHTFYSRKDQPRHTRLNLWTKKSPDFPLNHTLDYIYFSFLLANKIILLLTPETHVLLNRWTNVGFIPRTKKHFRKFFFKILFPLPCNNFLLEQLAHSLKSLFFFLFFLISLIKNTFKSMKSNNSYIIST